MDTIRIDKSMLHAIESHIWPIPECGCWLWDEEAPFEYKNCSLDVDELMFLIYRGSVPANSELYHTCHMNCCVNPDHMSIKQKLSTFTDSEVFS
jgi:hypothetical protein